MKEAQEYLDSLNSDVIEIILTNYDLEELPDLSRFTNIIKLNINNNNLSIIQQLPQSLKYLYCSNNNLETLCQLPNDLIELYCSDNNLTILPNLPDSLKILDCNNNIKKLPQLPNELNEIYCITPNL